MDPQTLLIVFLSLKLCQHLAERLLARLNYRVCEDTNQRRQAADVLGISSDNMDKALSYSRDKYRFTSINSRISTIISLGFIGLGGLGLVESWATGQGFGSIVTGLLFIGILSMLSGMISLPADLYFNFVIEQRHGFNRQTVKGFFIDRAKGLAIGVILGGLILGAILWIMAAMGDSWWVLAWLVMFGFSLLTVWLYPTFLAPLFNKFTPVAEGELRDKIFSLAQKVDFMADGVSIMDASTRSTHGNAYFTGVFGKKKIVLFDTLVKSMSTDEIVAVLAHELGHFKLHHIRWSLIRSFFITGLIFFLISLMMHYESLYTALGLAGASNYGALVAFSLWFGPVGFLLQPIGNFLSRRNEFDADSFALQHVNNQRLLGDALLKLRGNSNVMPLAHPAFSAVYHSHPPLLERLRAMRYI